MVYECLYCKKYLDLDKKHSYFNRFCVQHHKLPYTKKLLLVFQKGCMDLIFVIASIIVTILFFGMIAWFVYSILFGSGIQDIQDRLSNPLVWIVLAILAAGFMIAMAISKNNNRQD